MDCQRGGKSKVDHVKGHPVRMNLNPPLTQSDYPDYYGTLNGSYRIGLERDCSKSPWFYQVTSLEPIGPQEAGMLDNSIGKSVEWATNEVAILVERLRD